MPGPTSAERVRTVLTRAAVAQLAGAATGGDTGPVPCPVHHLLDDGSLAITVDARSPLAAGSDATVVVELLDRAPHPTTQAVRNLVWIGGWIRPTTAAETRAVLDAIAVARPDPALLDVGHRDTMLLLTAASIVLADAGGAEDVDLRAVLAARPDPFCHVEAAWTHHLERHHPEMVERLRIHLPRHMRRGRIQLLGLDRFGLAVRVGDRDLRIPFFAPVADDAALGRALRALMGCPMRGLRPGPGR